MQAVANKDAASAWSAIPAPLKLQVILVILGIVSVVADPLCAVGHRVALRLCIIVALFGTVGILRYKGMQLGQKYGKEVGHV
eukprot:4874410-Amphidinium_carterae.1